MQTSDLSRRNALSEQPAGRGPLAPASLPLRPLSRNALIGSLAALDVVGIFLAVANGEYLLWIVLLAALLPALGVAGLVTLVGVTRQPSTPSLEGADEELQRALSLYQRGLIDEDDYQQIKAEVLAVYRGGGSVGALRRKAAWAAGAASPILPAILAFVTGSWYYRGYLEVGLALALAAVIGAITGGVVTVVGRIVRPGNGRKEQLPAGPQYEQLRAPSDR